MRRVPVIAAKRPHDPRRRAVVSYEGGKRLRLKLECGHQVVRQTICIPTHVICEHCPAAGGLRVPQ
jgi:hypothetical protein